MSQYRDANFLDCAQHVPRPSAAHRLCAAASVFFLGMCALAACSGNSGQASNNPKDDDPLGNITPIATSGARATDRSGMVTKTGSPPPKEQERLTSVQLTPIVTGNMSAGTSCGQVSGAGTVLNVVRFPGSTADCHTILLVAQEFGPSIQGQQQKTVMGWVCGPSTVQGIVAQCANGSDSFGFARP